MERSSDTRTVAPNLMYQKPWEFRGALNAGLDWGNFKQATVAPQLTWYQNFCDTSWWAYYVDLSYRFQQVGDADPNHRARGTLRGDFHLANLSEEWKVSLGGIATASHDTVQLLDLRSTFGAGPWFNFERGAFENGASLFVMGEHEIFRGFPNEMAGRLSLRNISIVTVNDRVRFVIDGYLVPRIDDFRDLRASVAAGIDVGLWDQLKLTANVVYEYDSRPKPGVVPHDVMSVLGLSYAVGAPSKKE